MSERARRYAALPIQVFGEPLVNEKINMMINDYNMKVQVGSNRKYNEKILLRLFRLRRFFRKAFL